MITGIAVIALGLWAAVSYHDTIPYIQNNFTLISGAPFPIIDPNEACEKKTKDDAQGLRSLETLINPTQPRPNAPIVVDKSGLAWQSCMHEEATSKSKLQQLWHQNGDKLTATCFRSKTYAGWVMCADYLIKEEKKKNERLAFIDKMTPSREQVPKYDIDLMCRRQAQNYGELEKTLRDCFMREQEAYDEIKPIWARLSSTITKRCRDLIGQPGLYSVLRTCVYMDVDKFIKEQSMPNIQFRY